MKVHSESGFLFKVKVFSDIQPLSNVKELHLTHTCNGCKWPPVLTNKKNIGCASESRENEKKFVCARVCDCDTDQTWIDLDKTRHTGS